MDQDIKEKLGIFVSTNYNLNQEFEFCTTEIRLRMLRLYNMHFTNCRLWNFQSEMFNKLCCSYNTNLCIIYDLPYDAHNWIVEELSGGKHARQQMMSRYIKFVESLHFHKSPSVSSLLTKLKDDVRSLVGSNLRLIYLETNVHLIPGITKPFSICNHRVYSPESENLWKIQLLTSLLEIRNLRWEILFDEENGTGSLNPDDITEMIKMVSS